MKNKAEGMVTHRDRGATAWTCNPPQLVCLLCVLFRLSLCEGAAGCVCSRAFPHVALCNTETARIWSARCLSHQTAGHVASNFRLCCIKLQTLLQHTAYTLHHAAYMLHHTAFVASYAWLEARR